MGTSYSYYNPLSTYGQYNIKNYLYKHKKSVIVIFTTIIIVLIGVIFILLSGSHNPFNKKESTINNIPAPIYGNGPFGVGTYLPTKEILLDKF